MFNRINILQELKKIRREEEEKKLLLEATTILQQSYTEELEILDAIQTRIKHAKAYDPNHIDISSVFTIEQIKKVCIQYRMRFLDSDLFKGEIPYEAIQKIKAIQQENETKLEKFKILAPKRLFKLADADADPLLFVQLKSGHYYLIHQWGTDLKWFRKILSLPFQKFENLVVSLIILALILTLIIPNHFLVPNSNMALNNVFGYWDFHRITFFFHFLILSAGITAFIWFSFHRNFSDQEWNSKTFN